MTEETLLRTRGEKWLSLLAQLRPGEGKAVLMFFSYGFLVMFSYYMLKTLREPLLLTKATAETKSYAYALVASLLLIIVPLYGMLFRNVPKKQLGVWVNGSLIAVLFFFYLLTFTGADIGFAYYVWIGIFGVLVTAQFWAFATDTFNLKTGQRVFPLIMVGLSIGALVGPALAGELFKMFGPQVLMLIAVLVLSLTLPLIVWSRDAVPASSRSRYTRPESTRHDLLGGFSLIMKNRYLLLIAALVVLLNWVNSTGEFILADVVVRHADSLVANDPSLKKGDIIAGFYGGFFSIVNALSLLLQIFLVSRIFRWIGVHGAILILPVIALVGYGMMAFVPIFSMIRIVKIMENGTDYSLMNTARQALFLPLSASEKYEAKIAIDAFFWRFGDVIQAGVIYVGLNVLEFQVKQFAMLNMALALVWIGLALQIGRMYVRHKKLVTVDEPPQLVCALEVQVAPPGLPLDFQLPNSLFVSSDPGDVLTISARPVDGGSLPGWLKFDAELLRFQGVPPGDLDGMTWLTIRATNMEGGWSETRLGFNH